MQMEIDLADDDSVILISGEEHRINGNDHYKKFDYKAALECYTAAIDTEPDVALFYSNRSAANLMLMKFQDALTDAKKASHLDASNVKALIRLIKCHIILGNWDTALNSVNVVLRLDAKNNEILCQANDLAKCKENYEQYLSQIERGDFRHALHCMDNCIKISHGSMELKLLRVELFIYLKRYIEAKDILEKQIIDDKNSDNQMNTEAMYYRGLIFYYMEHLDKAQTHFQHVLKLNPDHKKAFLAYKRCKKLCQLKDEGNKLVRSHQYSQAHVIYSEALEVDSAHDILNAKLHFNRALTHQKLGQWQSAMDDCDMALLLDPSYEKVRTRRVQCMMGMEQWEEAVKEATRLAKQQPSEDHSRILKEAQLGLKRSKQVDLYKLLGVSKTADEAELKKGYRKRALVHHPDRHSHADEATRKSEEQKFKELNTAYSVLSDPRKKQMYDSGMDVDQVLGNGGSGGCGRGRDPHEVFHTFFQHGGRQHFSFQ